MSNKIKIPCVECGRAIDLQKRSLTRYYKRNNTNQYVCASCTSSKTGKRPISEKERLRRSANTTALWKDNDYRRKQQIAHQQITSQTEFKKKVSENNKKRWEDLEYRRKMQEKAKSEEYVESQAQKSKKNWENEVYRKRVLQSKFKKDELDNK